MSRRAWPRHLVLAVTLSGSFLTPSPEEQIRTVPRREAAAIVRDDVNAARRLTDLDYRAVCPRHRHARVIEARRDTAGGAYPVFRIDRIEIVHIQATAETVIATPTGERAATPQLVRDVGRWYIHGDAATCGVSN